MFRDRPLYSVLNLLGVLALIFLALTIACGGSAEDAAEEPTAEPIEEPAEEPTKEPAEEPTEEPTVTTQIVVDGTRHIEGPLPVIYYALTESSGEDVYPLGEGAFSLFGLYDSGSTKVRINDLYPPNRVAGPNWENSDTGHLKLTGVETVNLRLNGVNAREANGNIPIGPQGSSNEPMVEVRDIAVMPEEVNVSLIGAPVVNQVIASIDYTKLIVDPAIEYAGTGVRPPTVHLYLPGDSGIPDPDMTLNLEPFGNLVSNDATPGYRYWLRYVTFQHGDNVVSDQQGEFDFLFDTGTTLTIVSDRVANLLELQDAEFDCFGEENNGYYVDSVSMVGFDALYQIDQAAVCHKDDLVKAGDVVIGSNFFDQVQIIIDGPGASLGINR